MSVILPKIKTRIGRAQLNLNGASLVAYAIDYQDYTYDPADEFLSDIPGGSRVTSAALANVTYGVSGEGVLDCDDWTFPTVSGDDFEAIAIVNNTGSEATSEIVAILDNGGALTFTPDGNNVDVQVPAAGLFTL